MSKPLVCQVLWTLDRGGAEQMVFDLCQRLPSLGFRCVVLAPAGEGSMEPLFKDAKIPLRVGVNENSFFHRGKTTNFLEMQLTSLRPDIIHSHLGHVWVGRAVKELRRPWLITAHGFHDQKGIKTLLRRQAYQDADHVVAVSDALRSSIQSSFGLSSNKLSTIRLGIRPSFFLSRKRSTPSETYRLVSVARLVPEKNHTLLLRALANTEPSWSLTVVGDGPERIPLERRAKKMNLSDRVEFVGDQLDPLAYLKRADLFISSSQQEGQGLAILEAAAAGVPIITSDLPVIREKLDDRSVLFVKSVQVKDWQKAITFAATHRRQMAMRARRAQTLVKKNFQMDEMAKAYADVYHRLLREHQTHQV